MQTLPEQLEILKAAIVVAVADGQIIASERGLLNAIAARAGVGKASLDAMIERARTDPNMRDELFRRSTSDPELTLELLVAAARLDGEIDQEERAVLVRLMDPLKIPVHRFSEIYQRGLQRADALRKARQ
jgi:tellurite resistance protein